MAVTLRDVAQLAGVTPTVVSRVLHNRATSIRVSESTSERVRQAAKDLGYRVNVMARNFRERQTMMIGVLHGVGFARMKFDSGSRYFASLMDGIVDGAFKHGYSVTLCPKLLGASSEDSMSDGRFDGLVWYSTFPSTENYEALSQCSVPLVVIHTPAKQLNHRFPSVMCDNSQGIGLAVEHLASLGHRKIGFAWEAEVLFEEATIRGKSFLQHTKSLGLETSADDLIDTHWDRSGIDRYLTSDLRHTAIICEHDGLAADFLKKAHTHGISIPDQLSVIGFDSTSYCNELRPTLTSIYQPLVSMGEQAVEMLVQSIAGESLVPSEVIFPCRLDIRGSTTTAPK